MGFLKTFYDIFVRFMIFCLPFMMIIVSLYDIFFYLLCDVRDLGGGCVV